MNYIISSIIHSLFNSMIYNQTREVVVVIFPLPPARPQPAPSPTDEPWRHIRVTGKIGEHEYCDPSGGPDCHGKDLKGLETHLAIGKQLLKEGGPMTVCGTSLMHIMVVTAPRSDSHPWLQAAGLGPNRRKRVQAVSQALSDAHWLQKALDGSSDY